MHVLVLRVDLHLPDAQSLKARRSIVQSIVRTIDGWKGVGAAEVGGSDTWQRAVIGVTVVGGSVSHVESVAEAVDRHVWSQQGADVLGIERNWWEEEDS